jgi:hypothetical protein
MGKPRRANVDAYYLLSENLKRRDHLENMGIDGRILKLILYKYMTKPAGAQAPGSHPYTERP